MTRLSDADALAALRTLAAWLAPEPVAQPAPSTGLVGPSDVGVTARSWRAAVRRGELAAVRVGRRYLATREAVDAWLASRRVQPRPTPVRPVSDDPATRAIERARAEGRLRAVGGRRG